MSTPVDLLSEISEKLPYKVLVMIKDVLSKRDPQAMISKILSTSIEFTDMERAVLILSEEPPRIFKSTTLDQSTVEEICQISKSASAAAVESSSPYIRLDAFSDPDLKNKPSIIRNRIMSIVCMPLKARENLLGVLYLDSKERVETLASTELLLLQIFSSIIGMVLQNALNLEESLKESERYKRMAEGDMFPEIIGNDREIQKVRNTVYKLLNTNLPVLITGETGTGKEQVARVFHYCSGRKDEPYVAVDCSSLNRTLLENELFGHEKGAFTGAVNRKRGLIEHAQQGTIFLDEIGDVPFSVQSKLLRFLQEGEYRRVGGSTVYRSEARVLLATNRDLAEMVKQKRFREDLYYRIKGVQIHLPPLRERRSDLPLLAREFLKVATLRAEKRILGFTPEALELMGAYSWPGNIRELKNEIERIVALKDSEWIEGEDFDPSIRRVGLAKLGEPDEGTLRNIEKQAIEKRLQELNWNFVKTARALGLTRQGLYNKVKSYNIRKN